jgi:hypothetical protein
MPMTEADEPLFATCWWQTLDEIGNGVDRAIPQLASNPAAVLAELQRIGRLVAVHRHPLMLTALPVMERAEVGCPMGGCPFPHTARALSAAVAA